MKHTTPLRYVLLIALAFVVGRASVPLEAADKETKQMMADIRMLQEQAQILQNLIGTLSKTVNDAIEAAVKNVNARVDSKLEEQSNNTVKAFANQKVSIDAITRDLGVVREGVNDGNVRTAALSREIESLRQSVTQLTVAAARPAVDPDFGAPDQPTDSTAAAAAAPAIAGESPDTNFKRALGDYQGGRTTLAISGFQGFLKTFPTSDLADDAQFYICKSYMSDGNYDKAAEECDVVIRTYPTGDRVPDAYYNKGLALKSLKRLDEAKAAFEVVIKTYPNSEVRLLAEQQMNALKP